MDVKNWEWEQWDDVHIMRVEPTKTLSATEPWGFNPWFTARYNAPYIKEVVIGRFPTLAEAKAACEDYRAKLEEK